jgi:hypothetical protein
MAFWWTGRGFLTLLTVIGVWGVFGAILTFAFGSDVLDRFPWLWGVGLLLAAPANWWAGSRLNKRDLKPFVRNVQWRYFYNARHRFCGLPMETWSVPALAIGLFVVVTGLLATVTG